MSEKDIKIYEGKVFHGEKYKDQGVIDGDASVLELLEYLTGRQFIKIETQDLEDFLNGRLPFRDLNSLGLDKREKEDILSMIKTNLENFIERSGYRKIEYFVKIKQFEIDNARKLNYFRWDDMYFNSVYATDEKGYVRMISYFVPEENYFSQIPENLAYLSRLEILDLSYNPIYELPKNFGKLKSLKYLDLSGNEIEDEKDPEWCSTINQLYSLEYLDLSSIRLKTFPVSFGKLKKLRHLDFSANIIDTIPESIGNLRNLKYLNLKGNKIRIIPETIKNLKNLNYLDLSFNNIDNEQIPDSIRNLKDFKKTITDKYFIFKKKKD
ncbi:MAG: hypothetical protein GF317_14075 [Candidatus Lokiarchaeota archaeon]|nr:hypothetical protein [Candidatus Lokiarchaeota archaeon]MBD3200744.1 hypothetical protein [Candidatus Lokiarchaeota archaeon]